MNKTSIGDRLREGRLRHRLSILECSRRTHIATQFIEALEDERWAALPSESHRVGFLRLYARFLGVSPEEMLTLYRDAKSAVPAAPEIVKPKATSESAGRRWDISSWQQLAPVAVLLMVVAWAIYHTVGGPAAGPQVVTWVHLRHFRHPRLPLAGTRETPAQQIKITAQASSWLRVVENHRLLFEGILRPGVDKEWSGSGPFVLRIGDIHAISLIWNNQPVDLTVGASGNFNELRLPPTSK